MDVSNHDKGITSVVVHHQPGGASSFSLAHYDGKDDRFGNSGKVGSAAPQQQAASTGHQSTEE